MPPGLSKRVEAILHRMRLNVAYTRNFLFKIKHDTSPLCPHWDVRETLQHLLCECARFSAQRVSLAVTLGLPLSVDMQLKDVLGPWACPKRALRATKALIEYLQHTGLDQSL